MSDTPQQPNPFKGSNGVYYTQQLFWETNGINKSTVLYTLKDDDYEVIIDGSPRILPSLRRLYLLERDPTEYKVADKYFGGWPHWKKLLDSPWFLDYLALYRDELALLLASESYTRLLESAKTDTKINQYLLDKGFLSRSKDSVGRPSKEAIKRKAAELVEERRSVDEDLTRIMGVLQ